MTRDRDDNVVELHPRSSAGAKGRNRRVFQPGDLCKGGRYKIFDLLGAGGMCEVWQAFDDQAADYDTQWVAVKVLKSKLAFDDESKKRHEKEARALLRIRHENLVRVFHADVDEERNVFFYVMEHLKGETLDARIRRDGGLELADALRFVAEVADATHVLHQIGIIHRDLKPDNIFITTSGRAVVLDLGVAKFDPERFPDRATQPTGPNTILGTCPYMSPEQCLGSPLDARSDVYALGLILYAAIAGFHAAQHGPGGWLPRDYKEWAGWHLHNHPKPLPQVQTSLPERVWDVVACAMAKEPGDRFSSAEELSAELRGLSAWLDSHHLLRRPPPVTAPDLNDTAACALATTEETLTTRSDGALSILGLSRKVDTGRKEKEAVDGRAHAESLKSVPPPRDVARSSSPPTSVGVASSAAGPETPPPVTSNGTEIILVGPASLAAGPAPRTANGTEIIRGELPSRRPSGPPAGPRGNEPGCSVQQAEDPSDERRTGRKSLFASQNTPVTHAVPVLARRPMATSTRRILAFGGAGVACGVGLSILVGVIVGAARHAPAHAEAPSLQTSMAIVPLASESSFRQPAVVPSNTATSASPASAKVSVTATASASAAFTALPSATPTMSVTAGASKRTVHGAPPPPSHKPVPTMAPRNVGSDRILD